MRPFRRTTSISGATALALRSLRRGVQRCLPSPEIKHTVKRAEHWVQLVGAEQNGDPEFSLERLRQLDHVALVARVLSK
jgi:hypothetical protein